VKASAARRYVEVYSPVYRLTSRWTDRQKQLERPLFPGYVFAHCDGPADLSAVRACRGVVSVLPSNLQPRAVSDDDIETVRRLEGSGLAIAPHQYLVGECVEVLRGPLTGVQGVVKRAARSARLIVNIETFHGRAIAVELDEETLGSLGRVTK
jgi:transcriptional antiterminator NusG